LSTIEQDDDAPLTIATPRRRGRLRRIAGIVLMAFIAQYTIIALVVGLSVAATLRYLVTPQIVATFVALSDALKR
jgi:hypothetical protein